MNGKKRMEKFAYVNSISVPSFKANLDLLKLKM